MCIRDSFHVAETTDLFGDTRHVCSGRPVGAIQTRAEVSDRCLLYTSDAADERSSVDLGGRRIIKKKKHQHIREWDREHTNIDNR